MIPSWQNPQPTHALVLSLLGVSGLNKYLKNQADNKNFDFCTGMVNLEKQWQLGVRRGHQSRSVTPYDLR